MGTNDTRRATIVPPEGGRAYPMGRMRAVFKADNDETKGQSSVSEWWLEPETGGPPEHAHPDDHVLYVIVGVLDVCLNGEWSAADRGSYVLIPGGTPHAFENRSAARTGFISFNTPGGFETNMPGIAAALSGIDLPLSS